MALVNCPECGREISDQAVACPHCGFPMKDSVKLRADGPLTKLPDAAPRSFAKQKLAVASLVCGSLILILFYSAPVLRSGYKSNQNHRWADLSETRRHYYRGFNRWQLEFSSRYESPLEQQMPRIMGAAMLPLLAGN